MNFIVAREGTGIVFELDLFGRTVHQNIERLFGQVLDGHVERKAEMLCDCRNVHEIGRIGIEHPPARLNRPLAQRLALVGADEVGVHRLAEAEPRTGGASPPRGVEGEQTGFDFLDGNAAIGAGVTRRIECFPVPFVNGHKSVGEFERRFEALRQPLFHSLFDHETIDDNGNIVLYIFFDRDLFLQIVNDSVHLYAGKAALAVPRKFLLVFPLSAAYHGGFDHDFAPFGQFRYAVANFIHRLAANLPAAFGAMGHACPRVQKAQIIVNLRYRAHGGTGIVRSRLLIDTDCGRKTFDTLDVRLFHHAEELPRVGR